MQARQARTQITCLSDKKLDSCVVAAGQSEQRFSLLTDRVNCTLPSKSISESEICNGIFNVYLVQMFFYGFSIPSTMLDYT